MEFTRTFTRLFTALAALSFQYVVPTAAEPKASEVMTIENLNTARRVVGKLAHPLGTVVTVEGEVIDGTKLRMKSLEGVTLLQISAVNSQKLPEPCAFRFDWFATADAKKLKGRVKLVGFETGRFVGLPADAFSHIDPVASEAFHFESSFVVLKSL